ncbi:MAG: Inter-alpha-trypsin inhibitor domain protein [Labilithrix sp.]|nr:Inter-alpha-trypsin inhibitor domain protein [Labilithrix sp.]
MTLAYGSAPTPGSPYRMSATPADRDDLPGAELRAPDGRSLPLVGARLRARAGAGLARVVLEQTFENPYDETLHVTYRMPLPHDGAVSGYSFRIGARTIAGKIDRKESARARFEEAIATGHTAALLEQDKADVFTQEIGNLPARQTIVAEIVIDQRLGWTDEGEWELRFPTVIGPRYLGAEASAADRRASHVELADGGIRARLQLEVAVADALAPGGSVSSPSHRLRPVAGGGGTHELAAREGERLDRDIVVRWPVAQRAVGVHAQVARPVSGSPHGRHAYALVSIVPPTPSGDHETVPRDLIVLLDTSGSMGGPPLDLGKRVVACLIDSLRAHDRLEIVEFSMRPNRWSPAPVHATPRDKAAAIAWVMAREASGGTEMHAAVLEALQGLRPGAQRQVVLVTDGYVGGEERIVTLLHESLPAGCRLHVVGVGAAANRTLAASLARAGRGAEVLVGPGEDAERAARRLIDRTRDPVLTDLVLSGDALVEQAPEHLPDVFAGAPVLAALAVKPSGGELVLRGQLARGTWEQRIVVAPCASGEGSQAIPALFARERVADLEMRWTIGREVQAIDREIESLGMVFQIATRRTSWLAIDDDVSVDPSRRARREAIPQELPYGTTMASFAGAPAPAVVMQSMMVMPRGAAAPIGGGPTMVRKRLASLPAPARAVSRGTGAPPPPAATDHFGAAPPPSPLASISRSVPEAAAPPPPPAEAAAPAPVARRSRRWLLVVLLLAALALVALLVRLFT